MTTLLVASFHNRPQLLHFNPGNQGDAAPSLTLETLETPEFQDYTWISRHPTIHGLFYALQRYPDKHGVLSIVKLSDSPDEDGQASSSSRGRKRLEIIKSYPSHGMDPCHLGFSSSADRIAIANVNTSLFSSLSDEAKRSFFLSCPSSLLQYDSSTVTIYTLRTDDGMIDEDVKPVIYDLANEEKAGSFQTGPNKERQEAPHPHGCFYVEGMEGFLVPDLGADKLRLIGGVQGKGKERSIPCNKGAGPRHAVVNSKANLAYVINELDNTITIHDLSTSTEAIATSSILPSDITPSRASQMNGAAISITPDDQFIYVTNRLEAHPQGDAVVYFKITEGGRALERVGAKRTGLDHPRAAEVFVCKENGGWYYIVGSRTEKGAVVYEVDKETGELKEVARNREVIQPSGFALV